MLGELRAARCEVSAVAEGDELLAALVAVLGDDLRLLLKNLLGPEYLGLSPHRPRARG